MHDPLVSIIIPIYNEIGLIRPVLQRVRAQNFRKQLILVDDHSVDGTWEYLKAEEMNREDTIVLRHDKNIGKGYAIRTGLKYVEGEIVLIQDADMEYRPEQLPGLIQPIIDGQARVVYGSRFMGTVKDMKLPNRIANLILARIASILYGQRITDEATAYKVFHREVIDAVKLNCRRFEFCPEVTAKVRKNGERILELPVSFEARTWEEGKKICWPDFIEAVWILLKYRFIRD